MMEKDEFRRRMRSLFMPEDREVWRGDLHIRLIETYWIKANIANSIKPKHIVEIGVGGGYSAWALLVGCDGAAKSYMGYDAYNGPQATDLYRWAWQLLGNVRVPCHKIVRLNSQMQGAFPAGDFFHIDGDHGKRSVYRDMVLAYTALPVGGHILLDDYDFIKDVKIASDLFCAEREGRLFVRHYDSFRGDLLIRKL